MISDLSVVIAIRVHIPEIPYQKLLVLFFFMGHCGYLLPHYGLSRTMLA